MKKTIISMLLIIAVLAAAGCGGAAPAPSQTAEPTVEPSAEPVETEAPAQLPEIMPSYIANQVTVNELGEELIETTTNPDDPENLDNIINYMISEDTLVYDMNGSRLSIEDIKAGSKLSVYTNAYSPAPMIMPPQYQADVIIIEDPEAEELTFSCADTFVMQDDMLVGLGNTLALNLGEETLIVDREDNVTEEELADKDLLVFYGASTRSIPAQTTPVKVVVLGVNELALGNITAE